MGEIEQIPPMYSAIKKDGKKLYELARQGINIEREKRKVTIYSVKILEINMERETVLFEVSCSKGTYIRTLCDDIGLKLGCGAYMNKLTRIKSGNFELKDAYKPEQLKELYEDGRFEEILIPVDKVFEIYPKVSVNEREKGFIVNGVRVRYKGLKEGQTYRVYDENLKFLCLSQCVDERLTLIKAFWN